MVQYCLPDLNHQEPKPFIERYRLMFTCDRNIIKVFSSIQMHLTSSGNNEIHNRRKYKIAEGKLPTNLHIP